MGSSTKPEVDPLAQARAETVAEFPEAVPTPPPPPPPPPPTPGAVIPPAPEKEADDEVASALEELAANPEKLFSFTEGEIADFLELAFGLLADKKGDHWELPPKSAKRIAKWAKKALDTHGQLPEWLRKYVPHLMTVLLLANEWRKRVKIDAELAAAKPTPAPAPAGEPAPAIEGAPAQ